jgi:hypothetical protein
MLAAQTVNSETVAFPPPTAASFKGGADFLRIAVLPLPR